MTKTTYSEDKAAERTERKLQRPDTLNALSGIISTWMGQHQGQATGLHPHPSEAAKQWILMQEPPGIREAPNIIQKKGGAKCWDTPYLDRLCYSLTKFLRHGNAERNYIISAYKAGIFWRGDDLAEFKRLIEETETMHEIGLDAYRKRAISISSRAGQGMDMRADLKKPEYSCIYCADTGQVCENHPHIPWEGSGASYACDCGGAGMPCDNCCIDIPQDGTHSITEAFTPQKEDR